MNLFDVLTAPWAIQPEKLLEIQAIYSAHVRGERADLAAIEQKIGRAAGSEPPTRRYEVRDGVAVVPIAGVMAKRANLFMNVSGGVSTELAARDVRAAAADPSVHSIVAVFDTPGGAADGLQLLISAIAHARGKGKRVWSLADGLMASAGYWTGSASERVYLADTITSVGSIGVVATHVDRSAQRTQAGLKVTEVVAGRYKRIASDNGPLSEEGRQTLQGMVDHLYSVFVADVAAHRGRSVDQVLADMADGRVFIGAQAVEAGLADGVASLEELIDQLNEAQRAGASVSAPVRATHPSEGGSAMDRSKFEAEHPALFAELRGEFTAAGAAAERERIAGVRSTLIPGHEALVEKLMFDGATTPGDAALAVLAAERAARTAFAGRLAGDAPRPVAPAAVPAVDQPAVQVDPSAPVEQRCKQLWEADAQLRKEFSSLDAYTAYVRATERGVARIMNKQGA